MVFSIQPLERETMTTIMSQLISLETLDIDAVRNITNRYAIIDVLSTNPAGYKYIEWGNGMLRSGKEIM